MTLSASMWTSVSGLLSHSEKMNVVGNNLANVSTIGFKSQRMDFEDYMYVGKGAASGTEQVGQGAGIYTILGDFSQGSLQSTNSATDLAIEGNGFFGVRQTGTDQIYYTRAGDFYFNTDRQLQNPSGQIVQGWSIETTNSISYANGSISTNSSKKSESPYVGTGVSKDIVLDSWNLIPQRTTNVSITDSLINNDDYDYTTYADGSTSANPCAALFNRWNANNDVPLAENAYATQSTVDVYDASGGKHTLTVYMDRVNAETDNYKIDGLPSGYSMYEYLVTMPPSEDKRTYGGTYDPDTQTFTTDPTSFAGKEKAGVLMTGVLVFNASGQLVNQTAYTYGAQATSSTTTSGSVTQYAGDPDALASWQPTKISSNGYPTFAANFTGQALASAASDYYIPSGTTVDNAVYPSEDCIIELDFGLKGSAWTTTSASLETSVIDSDGVLNYNTLGLMSESTRENDATACNGNSFTTRITSDGYASGVLSGYNIDTDGVIYGTYSNGESIPLYQISLYDFTNTQGLYREGGNLYSATTDSGPAREGVAGDGLFGSIKSYNIEQSNVDMTTEFVQMISTQRGFQANSKTVTTVDTMLETVISMKR